MADQPSGFKPGDVVELNSGGGAMTVASVAGSMVKCFWLDAKRMLREAEFPNDVLKHSVGGPIDLATVLAAAQDQK